MIDPHPSFGLADAAILGVLLGAMALAIVEAVMLRDVPLALAAVLFAVVIVFFVKACITRGRS